MTGYLLAKSLHIVALVAWFAGLFYLPRLFVYHADTVDAPGNTRFKVMERRLYYGITTPAGVVTVALGLVMIGWQGLDWLMASTWLIIKLCLVAVLIAYHWYLGKLVQLFARDANTHSATFYRWINELPLLILLPVVILAVLKP